MSKQIRISRAEHIGFSEKLAGFSWGLFICMCLCLALSVLLLYSAGHTVCAPDAIDCNAYGAWHPWGLSQVFKILIGFGVFFIAAFSNIKTWLKSAYFIYGLALLLIILVTFIGHTGMGAQRWLNLGIISIQPSEIIKIAIVLVMARYFAWMNSVELIQIKNYIAPFLLFLVPFILVVVQPDLGTGISIALVTVGIFYIVGASKKWFIAGVVLFALSAPIMWTIGLQDYQRDRLITFIQPNKDLHGSGYQINQAKIAFGSGGIAGKGYLSGTQSQLSFLPENQTDFIFSMLGEEVGFIGAFILIFLYSGIILIMFRYAKISKNRFGQLLCFGFMLNFFVYYFINIAMVLGVLPTVGVPLPLVSFGGSSLLSLMFGFGLVQNAHIHRNQQLSAHGY